MRVWLTLLCELSDRQPRPFRTDLGHRPLTGETASQTDRQAGSQPDRQTDMHAHMNSHEKEEFEPSEIEMKLLSMITSRS